MAYSLPSELDLNTSTATVLTAILLLALSFVLLKMFLFQSKNHFPVANRTVLITGGSQGLGLAYGRILSSLGAHIIIVARTPSKLRSALAEIKSCALNPSTQRFESLSYDLTKPSSAPEILDVATQWNGGNPPDIIFNVAGYTVPGFFAGSEVETLREQMDTIYWSATYMAHAALRLWLPAPSGDQGGGKKLTGESKASPEKRAARHIIFTSSVLAFFPLAGYASYAPAKSAMRALADTLTQEVAVYNGNTDSSNGGASRPEIKIHTVFPNGILTPGFDNENKTKHALTVELEKDDKPQTAEDVARISLRALERGDGQITTMFLGSLMRGCGLSGSEVNGWGIVDLFWRVLGGIVILFIVPDFMRKCRRWGKERGIAGAR